MRTRFLALMIFAAGCDPDISGGTYFCGPERLCPEGQECDDNTFTCDLPFATSRFSCPAGSEPTSPDDTRDDAQEAGSLGCGETLLAGVPGCIGSATDVDFYRFEHDRDCSGTAPHLEMRLSFPIALVPLELQLLDDTGAVVADGEPCTPAVNYTGKDSVCIEVAPAKGTYYIRVAPRAEGSCGGDCANNQYTLDVSFPLS